MFTHSNTVWATSVGYGPLLLRGSCRGLEDSAEIRVSWKRSVWHLRNVGGHFRGFLCCDLCEVNKVSRPSFKGKLPGIDYTECRQRAPRRCCVLNRNRQAVRQGCQTNQESIRGCVNYPRSHRFFYLSRSSYWSLSDRGDKMSTSGAIWVPGYCAQQGPASGKHQMWRRKTPGSLTGTIDWPKSVLWLGEQSWYNLRPWGVFRVWQQANRIS